MPAPGAALRYRPGMAVVHRHFGPGEVTAVQAAGLDTSVTVAFADGSERSFLASLVADKLTVR